MELRFWVASDDLFEVEGGIREEYPANLDRDAAWVEVRVPDTDEGLKVHGMFGSRECWAVGVSQLDEGIALPNWPIRYETGEDRGFPKNESGHGYTVVLVMEVPDTAQITDHWPRDDD